MPHDYNSWPSKEYEDDCLLCMLACVLPSRLARLRAHMTVAYKARLRKEVSMYD
ncbi:hypothetical protein ACTXT7_007825 [Hymenolepis weldensis]